MQDVIKALVVVQYDETAPVLRDFWETQTY